MLKFDFAQYREESTQKIDELSTERSNADAKIAELAQEIVNLVEERDGIRRDLFQVQCELQAIRNWMGIEDVRIYFYALLTNAEFSRIERDHVLFR